MAEVDHGHRTDAETADRAGEDATRVVVRTAGYCVLCDEMVELAADGSCAGDSRHPREAVSCRVMLEPGERLPRLPRFNIAAFLIPPIWGPANRQWAGAVFLPMWLFADSVVASAVGRGSVLAVGAAVVVSVTLAAQAWFGKRANGLVWRRVCGGMALDEFAKRQRYWAIAAVPAWIMMVGWAVAYRVANPM